MGKTRDLFKKIGNTKGIFLEMIGTVKDRNGKDLKEVEDIKNTWQEYPEKLYKKGLNYPDNNNGVVIHQELDILEHEVKGAIRKHYYKQSLVEMTEFQLSYIRS